jgi:hypothetical protein
MYGGGWLRAPAFRPPGRLTKQALKFDPVKFVEPPKLARQTAWDCL